MDPWLRSLIFVMGFYFASSVTKITDLKVPQSIENGKTQGIVLDCEYEIDDTAGLTIKWFRNQRLIYQWIKDVGQPKADHKFMDILDLSYQATQDKNTMYRALRIKEISPSLSGEYQCEVSSILDGEDKASKTMIIYEPAKDVKIFKDNSSDEIVCTVYGAAPAPNVTIFLNNINETDMTNLTESVQNTDDGYYDVTVSLAFDKDAMMPANEFVCVVTIPGTNYTDRKIFNFYPDGVPPADEPDYESSENNENSTATDAEDNSVMLRPSLMSLLTVTLAMLIRSW